MWLLPPIAVFAAIVVYDMRVRRLLVRAQRAAAFYRFGLARIEDRWTGMGLRGERFSDPHHVYSADLDLFGVGGLFELICLARTRMGEEQLAKWLLAPANLAAINSRQEAVTELRTLFDLREDLAVLGEHATVGVRPDELLSWANAPGRLQYRGGALLSVVLAFAAVAGAIVWFVLELASPFLAVLAIEAIIVIRLKTQLSETIKSAESTFDNLELLSGFLVRVEQEGFHSALLMQRMRSVRSHSIAASRAIADLRVIVQRIQSRRNIFMAVLDVPLLITLRATIAAEAWRRAHGHAVEGWLNFVGEIEALSSIATYSYEHPGDPFPVFTDGPPAFEAQGMTHPLLAAVKAIRNDVSIGGATPLWLISGSNMSGKSTLLRTVGINAVLAMAGAPVRAERLQMTCMQVGASIRVNDSLHEGSSRFYAEITRLRQLYELATGSTPLLFLLDELLQGTNSADRRVGAQGVLLALINRGAIGLLSTHDLALAEIEGPDHRRIANVHFQDSIENGKMKFDYKLRPGVVTKSNALDLMRAIGLDV